MEPGFTFASGAAEGELIIHLDERERCEIDFSDELAAGETIELQAFRFETPDHTDVTDDFAAHGAEVSGTSVEFWCFPGGIGRFHAYCRVLTSTGRRVVGSYADGRTGPVILVER